MTVAGSWFISSICFGYVNAFGVYQTYYVETLLPSYSASSIAWIGSLQTYFLFAMGLVTGPLFDHGYFWHMMIVGSVLYVGTLFAQAQVQKDSYYQVFLSQAVGQGIAMGIIFLPSMAVIGHHFQKRRALAMGLTVTGSSVGGIIFPILVNNVFNDRGYVWGVRAVGFFVLGACVLGNLLMRPRYPPRHTKPPTPSIFKLLRDPPYVVSIGGLFLTALGLFFVIFYIQLYTLTQGISENLSFYTLAILNAASVVGRTLPNILADRFGILQVMIPTVFLSGAIVFAMFGVKSVGAVVIFCIMYGFSSGAVVSLLAPLMAALSDHFWEMGMRMGFAFSLIGIAALIGTPIDGALIGNGPVFDWWKAEIFSGIVMLAGCALLVVAGYLLAKKRGLHFP
ncbi:MFS general substrate transporter [Dacryopinax primogenitus]|uniref:MFS general substrate transporter n=1 Tax=Dacryopinax primogenitus (strain DJM 731) TaxID=1858805 RepID=M5FX70_DACPD|nr:MFS general substrate transporter [Dacryopinax primogenitus]EJU01034.1 MFS general substrate transporter [Dacryopinax primogenitus]